MLNTLDLFAGIGGFSLGLERTCGFKTVAFCEIEKFPQKVLNKHWPKVPIYEDVRQLTAKQLIADGITVDVITGGFPCQDISVAGRQEGINSETRSGLWSECARLVSEIRPQYAIFENVSNLLSGPSERPGAWFSRILADLAEIGYDAEWHSISAADVGAPHQRKRVWIVAYPRHGTRWKERVIKEGKDAQRERAANSGEIVRPSGKSKVMAYPASNKLNGCEINQKTTPENSKQFRGSDCEGNIPNTNSIRPQRQGRPEGQMYSAQKRQKEIYRAINDSKWAIEPNVGRVANGVPSGAHRLKSLGNALLPQIAEIIGNAILHSQTQDDIQ